MTLHREEVNSDSNGYIKNENGGSKVNNICKIYNIDLIVFGHLHLHWMEAKPFEGIKPIRIKH